MPNACARKASRRSSAANWAFEVRSYSFLFVVLHLLNSRISRKVGLMRLVALVLLFASFASAVCVIEAPSTSSAGLPVELKVSSNSSGLCYWLYWCDDGQSVSAAQDPSVSSFNCIYSTGGHSPRVIYYYGGDCADSSMAFTDECRVNLTIAGVDATPPVLTAGALTPLRTAATLRWSTSEPAKCFVEYGSTSAYGLRSNTSAVFLSTHFTDLYGLSENKEYHYAINCSDAAGNSGSSSDAAFTTLSSATPTPPVVTPSPSVETPSPTQETVSPSPSVSASPSPNTDWTLFLIVAIVVLAVVLVGLLAYLYGLKK